MKKLNRLKRWFVQSPKHIRVLFIAVFAGIGLATLLVTNAATPTASIDLCENTPLEGNAFIGHDHPNTSCGHYVSFGLNPPTNVSTSLTLTASGIVAPIDISNTRVAGDNRLFITSQRGKIHVSNKDGSNVANAVFLDLSSRIVTGGEQGLLGLAFDPNYAQNGYFYVNYIVNSNRGTFNGQAISAGDTVISRFTRSSGNPNVADPNSELVILGYDQPEENHNGGGLQFGPDGFLYIATGDGGGSNDGHGQHCVYGNGQCLSTYLAKILRIDVAGATAAQRYKIPAGNPFASTPGAKPEIWHYGLRNPWRFSFDRTTGDMLIGDVGQGEWEEIDFSAAGVGGKNFGWRCREGAHPFNAQDNPNCSNVNAFTNPIYEYSHGNGCSVSGGYIYRGTQHPEFQGTYIFSDYCNSTLRYLTKKADGTWGLTQTINAGISEEGLSSFGEDVGGELYLAILSGNVYRIDVSH
ncbi:MAG TPA: PQQ-dependent sugar dehydrogenase [Verrucomicrobiae bacterium]|nr:PQQ-dependent sugar dehydrogenase [Verrucomicrobiae bacterium]